MRTFSRWYKKPGRHDADLREQIEPMLKGQKILLEDFASFFPDERPCESLMDDFEEINLDDSGDNCIEDKESSFEEIELLDLEENFGTKRCTCVCHDSGDDTYRKKKKHCYSCGLTVIDGELVYKVNKTTIKKINVTFGPSVKLSSLNGNKEPAEEICGPVQDQGWVPASDCDDGRQEREENSEPVQTPSWVPALVHDNEVQDGNQEQGKTDLPLHSASEEKENIEHFDVQKQNEIGSPERKSGKHKSPVKESFLERISKLPRCKPSDHQVQLSTDSADWSSTSKRTGGRQDKNVDIQGVIEDVTGVDFIVSDSLKEDDKDVNNSERKATEISCVESKVVKTNENKLEIVGLNDLVGQTVEIREIGLDTDRKIVALSKKNVDVDHKMVELSETDLNVDGKTVEPSRKDASVISQTEKVLMDSALSTRDEKDDIESPTEGLVEKSENIDSDTKNSNPKLVNKMKTTDILATAFNDALNTEVSMDSLCFPFGTSNSVSDRPEVTETKIMNDVQAVEAGVDAIKNSVTLSAIKETGESSKLSGPLGKSTFQVSSDSSFSKVSAMAISELVSKPDGSTKSAAVEEACVEGSKKRLEPSITPLSIRSGNISDGSRSPPFSPFSPFAQEIQSITSIQSPLSAVNNPGISRSLSTSSKVRRITPIPVKDADVSVESPLAFQTLVQNSPVLPELQSSCSPSDKLMTNSDQKIGLVPSISVAASASSPSCSKDVVGKSVADFTVTDSNSKSRTAENLSQKSSGSSSNSNTNELLSSQTSSVLEAPSGNLTISRPEIHSDNANVGFPKSLFNTGVTPGGILSEESLFQCLSKPPEFTDTLHTVSGLTNILNALENQSKLPNTQVNQAVVTVSGTVGQVSAVNKSHQIPDSTDSSNGKEPGDISVNTRRNEIGSVPEPLCGIKDKPVAVDSQIDVDPVEGDLVDTFSNVMVNKNIEAAMVSDDHADSTRYVGSPVDRVAYTKSPNSNEEVVNNKDGCLENNEKVFMKSSKHTRSKMTRRELRRSLQGKDLDKTVVENEEIEVELNSVKEEAVEIAFSDSGTNVTPDKNQNELFENNEHDKSVGKAVSDTPGPKLRHSEAFTDGFDVVRVKSEKDLMDGEVNYSEASDVQSVSDAVSDSSSRGRRKSKQKRRHRSDEDRERKKKKRRKERSEETKPCKHKKGKKKKDMGQMNTSSEQLPVDSEKEISSPALSNPEEENRVTVMTGTEGARNDSPCSIPNDGSDAEPEWSKETDKTILETCKVHGIKEKTFAKIAKRIGNVTAKQVRKRFSTLYKMIFGSVIPASDNTTDK